MDFFVDFLWVFVDFLRIFGGDFMETFGIFDAFRKCLRDDSVKENESRKIFSAWRPKKIHEKSTKNSKKNKKKTQKVRGFSVFCQLHNVRPFGPSMNLLAIFQYSNQLTTYRITNHHTITEVAFPAKTLKCNKFFLTSYTLIATHCRRET